MAVFCFLIVGLFLVLHQIFYAVERLKLHTSPTSTITFSPVLYFILFMGSVSFNMNSGNFFMVLSLSRSIIFWFLDGFLAATNPVSHSLYLPVIITAVALAAVAVVLRASASVSRQETTASQ